MFPVFLFPFCSYTRSTQGYTIIIIIIIIIHTYIIIRGIVFVCQLYYVCVYAVRDHADVCSGITILNVPAGSTNLSSTNCRLLLSKYVHRRLMRKSRTDDRPGAFQLATAHACSYINYNFISLFYYLVFFLYFFGKRFRRYSTQRSPY